MSMMEAIVAESLPVPRTDGEPDNNDMTILLIILVLFMLGAFGGGISRPAYRRHGISIGTILLIILVLWVLGVFGSRPF
jgi:uncharacterized membrane protein YoaK (UPF0700 family)